MSKQTTGRMRDVKVLRCYETIEKVLSEHADSGERTDAQIALQKLREDRHALVIEVQGASPSHADDDGGCPCGSGTMIGCCPECGREIGRVG